MVDIQEELIDNQTDDKDEFDIFTSFGSFALIGGAGYFIYQLVKNNSKK